MKLNNKKKSGCTLVNEMIEKVSEEIDVMHGDIDNIENKMYSGNVSSVLTNILKDDAYGDGQIDHVNTPVRASYRNGFIFLEFDLHYTTDIPANTIISAGKVDWDKLTYLFNNILPHPINSRPIFDCNLSGMNALSRLFKVSGTFEVRILRDVSTIRNDTISCMYPIDVFQL